jgi:hypothetical protein
VKLVLHAALAIALAVAVGPAAADTVYLEAGGKVRGEIVEESPTHVVVRTPYGSTTVIQREDIAKIERDQDPDAEFQKRAKALNGGDAQGFFDLGRWAKSKGLDERAKEAYARAIQADPDHAEARAALGHRRHRGRWYDEAGYKKAVEGLVEWNGQWVTPAEKELLEQGFVRNDRGQWVRAEDLARQEGAGGSSSAPAPAPATPKGPDVARRDPPKPPAPTPTPTPTPATPRPPKPAVDAEDDSWYDDHETVMTWEEATKPGKAYESKFYKITTNLKPEYAKRYGQMMDQYAVRFQQVFKNFMPKGGFGKSEIWIYPSQAEFQAKEQMGEGVGGYYSSGNRRVVCYHGRFGPTGTTRTVLAHEGTHQFEHIVLPSGFGQAPIWIIEGFAVFFESAAYDAKAKKVHIGTVPRDRLMNLKQGIQSNSYIKLAELIRTPQSSFSGYHYAHAWSVVYYLIYSQPPGKKRERYQKVFSDLFFLARTKRVTPEDVEALWGGKEKFEAFETEWKQWVLDLPYDFNPSDPDADDDKDRDREKDKDAGKDKQAG